MQRSIAKSAEDVQLTLSQVEMNPLAIRVRQQPDSFGGTVAITSLSIASEQGSKK
jgi:hypothetical protein